MHVAPDSQQITIVKRVPIEWHKGLSVFASERFLGAVGNEYGWLGGTDGTGRIRCVLPYTVIKKASFRLIRFRVETIPMDTGFSISEEKEFLNKTIEYFRSIRSDLIIPATTNSVFRTYPDGAIAAPYGSYIIDLNQSEDSIWSNMSHGYRKDIRAAAKRGVQVRTGFVNIESAYIIIKNTFKRSNLPFMSIRDFKRYINELGENVRLYTAEYDGIIQSCAVYPFSAHCAYGVYGGSIAKALAGSFKIIQWEAMKQFKEMGVKSFDLVGARINPKPGSKQEGIAQFKRNFGGVLRQGYMWKFPINRLKYIAYQFAARVVKGGDIVDKERHK